MEETTETVECTPIPLKEWIEGGTEEECRPCLMGPVVEWYRDILDERGMPELAREVEQTAETASPTELAQKLDDIKATVDEEVRNRLKDFDCAMQNYKAESDSVHVNLAETQKLTLSDSLRVTAKD